MINLLRERDEWKHIAVYENGKRDMALTILSLFESRLPDDVRRWLRVETEMNDQGIRQAKEKIAAIDAAEVPKVAMIEVSLAQARLLMASHDFEVFALYDDGTESVIATPEEFVAAERYGIEGELFGEVYDSEVAA